MLISPIHLKILAYTLEVEGFDAGAALRCCGAASLEEIQEDGPWVPAELFDRMMAVAVDITGDAAFGLVAGKSLALMRYGAITPLVLPTSGLRQLLEDLRRFARLVLERSEIELVEASGSARLVVQPVVHNGHSGRFRMEQVATSALQMLRFTGANNADILQVEFPYPQPEGLAQRYAATFGSRIGFGARECAIAFSPALLDARLATHDPVSYMAARTRAESLLAALTAGTDVAEMVRQWLLSAFPNQPCVADTAVHLGMSERSLRRHLFQLGTTHADLAQECQRMMAERLLAEGKLPLKQVSEALGFSSVHSFHRAFRRWSGETPLAWRATQRHGGQAASSLNRDSPEPSGSTH